MFISKGGTLRTELLNYVLSQLGQILIRFLQHVFDASKCDQNLYELYSNNVWIVLHVLHVPYSLISVNVLVSRINFTKLLCIKRRRKAFISI